MMNKYRTGASVPDIRKLAKLRTLVTLLAASPGLLAADTVVWTGTGADANWQTTGSWSDNAIPSPGDVLSFGANGVGNFGGVSTNDFIAGTQFDGFEFTDAGAFTIGGNSINLNGDISHASADLQTINNDLALLQDVSVDADGGGVTLGGSVSGAFGIIKSGQSHFRLTGANTFTGDITNTAGLFYIEESGSVDSGVSVNLGGYDTTDTESRLRVDGVGGTTKTVNGVTLTPGRSQLQSQRSSGSGTFTLEVGAITRQTGGVLSFATSNSDIHTTSTNTNGILGGWATTSNGRNFATVDVDGNLATYNGYTDLSGAGTSQVISSDATTNVRIVDNSVPLTGVDVVETSTTVTIADTTGLVVGDMITGINAIPQGATIVSIDSATEFTISAPATEDGTGLDGEVYDPVITMAAPGTTDVNTIIKQYGGDGTQYPRSINVGSGNTLRLGQYGAILRAEVDESSGFRYPTDTLLIDGGVLTAGGADNTNGEIVFSSNGRHVDSSGNSSRNHVGIEVSSEIQDNGSGVVSMVIDSDQSTQFSGAASGNTYSGGTYINSGRLISTVNGNIGTGDVTVHSGGTNGGQLQLAGGGTYANNMSIAGFGYSGGTPAALYLTDDTSVSGDITLLDRAGIQVDGTSTISSMIDASEHQVTLYGSSNGGTTSDITLTNAASDFSGGIRLQNRAGAYTNASPLYVNIGTDGIVFGDTVLADSAASRKGQSSTFLNLQGHDLTIGGLTGAGNGRKYIQNSADPASTATFTLGHGSSDYSLMDGDYYIRDGDAAAVLNLVKTGSGTQELAGTTHQYTGSTTVNQGELIISGTLTGTSGVTVNGGTFGYTNDATALDRDVTIAGGQFRYDSTTDYAGTLTFTSGVLGGTNWNGALSGLVIGSGLSIAPGNSPGQAIGTDQTWSDGGSYSFEINDANGTLGINWDHVALSGELDISGLTSGGFTLDLISLDGSDEAGALTGFDPSQSYSWEILDYSTIVGSYTSDLINVDTSEFANPFGGVFSVNQIGDTFSLDYSPVPEPATYALLFAGIAGAVVMVRRRRK